MLRRCLTCACAAALAVCAIPASAHDIPANLEMNAFVKLEQNQAHLVIRVPLYVLGNLRFPVKNGREIDFAAAAPATQKALHMLSSEIIIWENATRLHPSSATGRPSLPSDRSFETFDQATTHVAEPIPPDTTIYYDQGFLDAHFIYPIASPHSRFTIRTLVAPELKDYLKLIIRYLPPDEGSRAFLISSMSGAVKLNPSWYQAAGGFVALGIEHILSGADHLLFLFCLIIPIRRIRTMIPVVTAFTLAHSVTLIGSAYHLAPTGVWFPPFVETAIAVSIVYMALENILTTNLRRRWLITGLFGLVHGFGFSYALQRDLQFAGSHLLVSLFSFNLGIEIGQLVVLTAMVAGLSLLFRRARVERIAIIVLSALVAHTGWHWMTVRAAVLWNTEWPPLDAASLMLFARWIAALLLAGGAAILFANWAARRWPPRIRPAAQPAPQPREKSRLPIARLG